MCACAHVCHSVCKHQKVALLFYLTGSGNWSRNTWLLSTYWVQGKWEVACPSRRRPGSAAASFKRKSTAASPTAILRLFPSRATYFLNHVFSVLVLKQCQNGRCLHSRTGWLFCRHSRQRRLWWPIGGYWTGVVFRHFCWSRRRHHLLCLHPPLALDPRKLQL